MKALIRRSSLTVGMTVLLLGGFSSDGIASAGDDARLHVSNVSVSFPHTKTNGQAWDPHGNAPDPEVLLVQNGATLATAIAMDDFNPPWNPAPAIRGTIQVSRRSPLRVEVSERDSRFLEDINVRHLIAPDGRGTAELSAGMLQRLDPGLGTNVNVTRDVVGFVDLRNLRVPRNRMLTQRVTIRGGVTVNLLVTRD